MKTVYILRRIENDGYSYLSDKTLTFIKQKFTMGITFKVAETKIFNSEQEAESYLNSHEALRGLIEVVKVIIRKYFQEILKSRDGL